MAVRARRHFKDLIAAGHVPLGAYLTSTDPATTEIFAKVGYDFVIIDREHGPFDNQTTLGHIRAAEAGQIIPLVRVAENSATAIQSALDLGAEGVIVPKVQTAEEARNALAASLYAPRGNRGMCNGCHAAGYCGSELWPDHQQASDENVIVIPLIETRRGVDNIDEIADVAGIDFVFFGPGDLAAELGLNLLTETDRLMPSWSKVREAAHKRGKFVVCLGILGFDAADMFAGVMDLMMLRAAAAQSVEQHRTWRAARAALRPGSSNGDRPAGSAS